MKADQITLLPWLESDWEVFADYIRQKRVPQAVLVTGRTGLGKSAFALQIAQALVCDSPVQNGFSCNQCHACTLFSAHTHPDVFFIKPEEPGKAIVIAQIRSLIEALALSPQFQGYRVVIIDPADQMNSAAANAFLKCLEEPALNTVILLVSADPRKLPATIRSRCQQFKLNLPDSNSAELWLAQSHRDLDCKLILKLAHGAPLMADKMADSQSLEIRKKCFDDWIKIIKNQLDPVCVAESWQNYDPVHIFAWLTVWVMDLIRYSYFYSPAICYNPDLAVQLQAIAAQVEKSKLDKFYRLLLRSKLNLPTQINKHLMIEECLIYWSRTKLRN